MVAEVVGVTASVKAHAHWAWHSSLRAARAAAAVTGRVRGRPRVAWATAWEAARQSGVGSHEKGGRSGRRLCPTPIERLRLARCRGRGGSAQGGVGWAAAARSGEQARQSRRGSHWPIGTRNSRIPRRHPSQARDSHSHGTAWATRHLAGRSPCAVAHGSWLGGHSALAWCEEPRSTGRNAAVLACAHMCGWYATRLAEIVRPLLGAAAAAPVAAAGHSQTF